MSRSSYLAALEHVGLHPCSDGGCILLRPTGQHTNGGCQHLKSGPRLHVIAMALAEALRLSHAIDEKGRDIP